MKRTTAAIVTPTANASTRQSIDRSIATAPSGAGSCAINARLAQEAKNESARETEAKVKKAADKINLKVESAERKIREAVEAARAEIEAVAAEATQEMVERLTGLKVDNKAAAAVVKAELNV